MRVKFLPRDDSQKEAIRFLNGSDEFYKYRNYPSFLLSLGTGKGKTYCSIVSAILKRNRTMVITSSIEWLTQWKKCILRYCDNIHRNEVYTISGYNTIAKLVDNPEMVNEIKFFLVSDASIRSYGERFGWSKVSELFKILRIGTKIYDECHLHFDTMCMIDFFTNTNLTYYLSATPLRSKLEEDFIYQLYFKNVPSLGLMDLNPHTHYVSLLFNSNPTAVDLSNCNSNKYGLNRVAYVNYLTNNDNFYKMLRYILNIIKGKKTLIYIGINESILKIKDWIVENYPELEDEIGVYTTLITDRTLKNKQLEKNIILSTIKSTGASVDIAGLKCVVVLADPFKSEVLARQTIGRTRDNNTVYIDVVDTGFAHLRRYYKYKIPIFKKYALSIKEIKVSQSDLDNA